MHKRERQYPFSKDLESENYFLNQKNFNYSNIDNLYESIASFYKINSSNLLITAGCDIALRTIYESLDNIQFLHLPNNCYAMNFIYKKDLSFNSSILDFEFDSNGKVNIEDLIMNINKNDGKQMVVIESPSGFTGQNIKKNEFKKLLEFFANPRRWFLS